MQEVCAPHDKITASLTDLTGRQLQTLLLEGQFQPPLCNAQEKESVPLLLVLHVIEGKSLLLENLDVLPSAAWAAHPNP